MIGRPLAFALLIATISPAIAEEPPIADTVVAAGVAPAQRAADLAAVRAFYGF